MPPLPPRPLVCELGWGVEGGNYVQPLVRRSRLETPALRVKLLSTDCILHHSQDMQCDVRCQNPEQTVNSMPNYWTTYHCELVFLPTLNIFESKDLRDLGDWLKSPEDVLLILSDTFSCCVVVARAPRCPLSLSSRLTIILSLALFSLRYSFDGTRRTSANAKKMRVFWCLHKIIMSGYMSLLHLDVRFSANFSFKA